MIEATYSSETSVDFQQTTRRYIPEDETLRNYRYENLKPYFLQYANEHVGVLHFE
jgi:hypothetical protein